MKIKNGLKPFLNICFFVLLFTNARSQDSLAPGYIDISKIQLGQNISKPVSNAYIDKAVDEPGVFSSTRFLPGIIHKKTVPNEYVTRRSVLLFNVVNSADTAIGVYFFPGFYYEDIRLFRAEGSTLTRISDKLPKRSDSIGFRYLSLAAHDSATIVAELSFVKTYINAIRPRLINPDYLDAFIAEIHSARNESDLVTYVFCGLLLMMVLYSIANFLQGANPEFLYYSGYAFFLGFMLFTKAALNFHTNRISYFSEAYLDFIMQGLGIMFYMLFMQKFLSTKTQYVFLHRLYNTGIAMLLGSMVIFTFFHYFTNNYTIEYYVELITKFLLLVMVLIFLVYSFRHRREKLLRYLFWGNLLLFIFSIVSQSFTIIRPEFKGLPEIFNSSLFYYEIGLLLELVFFLAGLNHKNRRLIIAQTRERERLKAENQLKEYEKELAVYKAQQQERERISADMHDELGSGMTVIRLMSEIARNKMKENTPVEIEKISQSANDVLNKMNAIIWSMNIGNDSLDNLVSYIRSYAIEYFDNTQIQCIVHTPEKMDDREITGDKRRNIFLCVKETLNNALKHSKAETITIDIKANHSLIIVISDDGVGIDMQHLRQWGNGLKNIARRMESIGGSFSIRKHNGTETSLILPL
jgi:signal transduction histidine kinase